MVQGRSICLARHFHGLVSVQDIRGLTGFLSSIVAHSLQKVLEGLGELPRLNYLGQSSTVCHL